MFFETVGKAGQAFNNIMFNTRSEIKRLGVSLDHLALIMGEA